MHVPKPASEPNRVITVLNLKGGVGKTHTTWLLASVCQERGQRALLIDTDTQGNLSNSFVDELGSTAGVEMLLHPGSDRDPLPLIRRTAFSHIDIIPSGPAIAPFDLSNQADWEKSDLHRCFIDPVQKLASQYDFILFDCPPFARKRKNPSQTLVLRGVLSNYPARIRTWTKRAKILRPLLGNSEKTRRFFGIHGGHGTYVHNPLGPLVHR